MRMTSFTAESGRLQKLRVRRLIQGVCLLVFLVLFLYVCWPYGSPQYAQTLHDREVVDAELFLLLDPLVSLSTAIAARMLLWCLIPALGILLFCIVFPRAFCGYLCPLGTLFDGFDGLVGVRVTSSPCRREGWWVNARFYILAVVLAAAAFGVLLSGFVAAIPVLTRAMLLIPAPLQMGLWKGWYLVPPMNAGHVFSILLFMLMFGIGLLGRRFWCRHVCPTGALFSITSVLRLTERRVTGVCVKCGKCLSVCSFAAIDDDFSTRPLRCTGCRDCRRVCPSDAITFTWRWSHTGNSPDVTSVQPEPTVSRRGVLVGLSSAAVVGVGTSLAIGGTSEADPPIRPPGSVPEPEFLQLCVRCGQCIKVCPNNVLQPAGFEYGLNALWTPRVVADWSGCEPTCGNCGHVCPTGAVRALRLEEKRAARIGLAVVSEQACLPYAGRGACQLCVDECRIAGYDAIEFIRVGGELDENGRPIEGSGHLAPVVREDRCIGCGLCQMRCHAINVKAKKLLSHSAVQVMAGEGKEDRIMAGSYIALRSERAKQREDTHPQDGASEEYLPDFLR